MKVSLKGKDDIRDDFEIEKSQITELLMLWFKAEKVNIFYDKIKHKAVFQSLPSKTNFSVFKNNILLNKSSATKQMA